LLGAGGSLTPERKRNEKAMILHREGDVKKEM
jgi:hypothetical protein